MCSSLTCYSLPTKAQIKPYCVIHYPRENNNQVRQVLTSRRSHNLTKASTTKQHEIKLHGHSGRGGSKHPSHPYSPWLQTWDKLRIWARELILTFLQHSGKYFVNPPHETSFHNTHCPLLISHRLLQPCSSGCFKSFTVPSLTQQSAMSQAEPSGFSWKPWCQCSHWQMSQQHDCIRRVEDTCLQNNWQKPKHHWDPS